MQTVTKSWKDNRKPRAQSWDQHPRSARRMPHERPERKIVVRMFSEEETDLNPINLKRRLNRETTVAGTGKRAAFSFDEQFLTLAKRWKKETAMFATAYDKINHPNYLTIIGMGMLNRNRILTLILEDLQKGPDFWHYALKSITQQNPVPNGMVNNLSVVRSAWLQWGQDHQIL